MSTTLQKPTTAHRVEGRGVTGWSATKLIAAREISVKLRDKAFMISAGVMLAIVGVATVLPAFFGSDPGMVATVPGSAASADTLTAAGFEVRAAPDAATAEQWVRDDEVDAALLPDAAGSSPSGVTIVANNEAPDDLVAALSMPSPVVLLDADALDPALAFLIPFALAIIFFMTSLTFGLAIAQSVTEEKQTRIVEILVAAVPVRALLAGKVLGNAVLALGQIALIVVVALVGMRVAGSDLFTGEVLARIGEALLWFIPFFVVGFLLLAGLWAVAGALVSRVEDLGSTTTPIQMLVMIPFFVVTYGASNPTLMAWLSYIPFSAPTAMTVRIFQGGTAGVWEPALSLGITAISAVAVIALAARLYEGSLLRTNGKTSYKQAWSARA